MANIVEIRALSFAYPKEEVRALDHIHLNIGEGEFLVLCGKSGCGKSTLLTHLKTPLTPHGKRKGEILFGGQPLAEMENRDQAQRIGYVLQNPDNQIVTDKVWHELAFGLESLGYSTPDIRIRVAEMASYFGIQDWFYKNVADLSGGQKQLLNLASIMAMHPDLLVLDEPTSQLDPIAASDFLETVKKIHRDLGTTIVLTEHRLEEVFPAADRVVVMDKGKIYAQGSPAEIGDALRQADHDMFLAMPVPMQVFAEVMKDKEISAFMADPGRNLRAEEPLETKLEERHATSLQSYDSEGLNRFRQCPVTVRDGRQWLEQVCRERGILPAAQPGKNQPEKDQSEKTDPGKNQPEKNQFGKVPSDKDRLKKEAGALDLSGSPEGQTARKHTDNSGFLLECRDLWFRYEKDLPDVVKGASFQIKRGEFYCLLGGNGTGKSTTLSLLCRLRKPYRGKVILDGKDIRKYKDNELFRSFLGVLPQNPQSLFVKKTVEEELYEMIGGPKEKKNPEYHLSMEKGKAVEGIAEVTHLKELLHRHPYDLSGGEQQRLALAKILLLRPKLLLMDEPTKGLDSYFKQEFAEILALLKAQGVTIFMISHDIEFCAAHADRCGLFFDGNVVVSGSPREFFAGNNFYTTAANRMARKYFPDAVTGKDVVECLRQ